MKKKVLVLMLTAGMLTSGLAANTFASDSNEEFTQFAEETESTEGMTAESVDSDLDFVDAGEAKETEESGDIFSDTEDFTTGTEISDADSSGEMQESEQEVMDSSEVGGAPLMGVRGTVIKAHGNSDAKAIKNAIGQAVKFTETDVVGKISASLSE